MDMAETSTYYTVSKYLLHIIGQWPYQAKLKKFFIRSLVYISLITFIIPQLIAFREAWGDMDATIECIPPTIIAFASVVLFTNLTYNVRKMELLFSKIKEDWITWSSGEEVKILRSYADKGKSLSVAYAILVFAILVFFLTVPILPPILDMVVPLNSSRTKTPLYPGEYFFFDVEDYFYWVLMHGYLASIITMVIIVTVDTLYMVILQHACGILSILGFRLNNILQTINKSKAKLTTQESIDQEIIFCAKKHKHVIMFVINTKFVNDIRKCFSSAFFFVLGLNMLNMVVTGVQTVIKLDDLNEVIRFGSYTFGNMFHLLFLTVPSQNLIDHSINISDCIYDGYWYELAIQSQKMLLIIMRRSSEPCSFTAGKLYIYSMQNFATVLQTSLSYFTVLLSFCQYSVTLESGQLPLADQKYY